MNADYEIGLYNKGYQYIAGIDEVGRGPLAGPVVAACVIMPTDIINDKIKDSKKIAEKTREIVSEWIIRNAVCYAFGVVDEKTIDEINILNATKRAFNIAYSQIEKSPNYLLIDGKDVITADCEARAVIGGDNKIYTIAAASVIAKVYRDNIMRKMDEIYPQYGFIRNKGYGTKEHIDALKKYGPCPIHRMSFIRKIVGV
ncbi:MAG: ribonuclease HII [Eubacteriales bacterium]